MENMKEVPLKKYLSYGMPRTSTSIVLGIVDVGLLTLYTKAYLLLPFFAGLALGFGKLSIAVSQFLIGWLSDKTDTELGRRKPYMIVGAPILAISFVLLLLPNLFIDISEIWYLFIWMMIWDVLFQFSYGALTTPYQSWMAEQFKVVNRPKASSYQNLFGFLGTGIGTVFVFLVIPMYTENPSENFLLFSTTTAIFGVLIIILYYLCAYILPIETTESPQMNIVDDVRKLFKDTNFMKVCLLQGIAFLAWGMVTPTLLTFTTDVLGFEGTLMYIAAGVLFLGIIVFLFLWRKLIETHGKKPTISLIFFAAVIILPFSLIGLLPGGVPFFLAIIYVVGVAACLGGWYLFPYIWYADLAEDAKRRGDLKEMKAGLYAGFPNILLNIFQAIALVITGVILSLPVVPGRSFSWGYVLWGVWCSAVLLIGFLYIRYFITLDFRWEEEK
ncbi:MAG: MFS transporter [Promethearchaeia archaeon]